MKNTIYIILLSILLQGIAITNSQAQSDQKIITVANEIINNAPNCGLITIDENGHPSIRMMDPFKPDASYTIWMATNPNSKKVSQIQKNPKVSLYYLAQEDVGYVMLQGMATLVNDPNEKAKHWKEGWEAFYPNKEQDYLLIKVRPLSMEVVSYKHNLLGNKKDWGAPKVSVQN